MPSSTTNALIENYTTTGFHGTSQSAARSIQLTNFMTSRGEDEWLGNGAYFFESIFSDGQNDAKNWACVQAWDGSCNSYKIYAVLKAEIVLKKLWDLSSSDGLKLFEHCRKEVTKLGLKYHGPKNGRRFDNAVIEFVADRIGFDGLRCWFFIKLDRYSRKMQVMPGIPNVTVLCVRNPGASISLDQISSIGEGYINT